MLAEQMAATHVLAMKELGHLRRAENVPQHDSHGSMAVKLLRTFAMQTEALAKLKRGGEQTVRVEHVHVYPGGQAIVGTVTRDGGSDEEGDKPMDRLIREPLPLRLAPGAWRRTGPGTPCRRAAAKGKKRCKLHGGADGIGAPEASGTGAIATA